MALCFLYKKNISFQKDLKVRPTQEIIEDYYKNGNKIDLISQIYLYVGLTSFVFRIFWMIYCMCNFKKLNFIKLQEIKILIFRKIN